MPSKLRLRMAKPVADARKIRIIPQKREGEANSLSTPTPIAMPTTTSICIHTLNVLYSTAWASPSLMRCKLQCDATSRLSYLTAQHNSFSLFGPNDASSCLRHKMRLPPCVCVCVCVCLPPGSGIFMLPYPGTLMKGPLWLRAILSAFSIFMLSQGPDADTTCRQFDNASEEPSATLIQ